MSLEQVISFYEVVATLVVNAGIFVICDQILENHPYGGGGGGGAFRTLNI